MFIQKTCSTTDEILIWKCVPAHSVTPHAAFDNLRCKLNKPSSPDLLSGTQIRGYHIFEMAYTSPQPLPEPQFSAHALQRNCQVISLICYNTVTTQNLWFFRRNFYKGFEVLLFSMSSTTSQLLSSGEFCKLRYDTMPVKSASANVSFYTNNSKMRNIELWHSCCKLAICL